MVAAHINRRPQPKWMAAIKNRPVMVNTREWRRFAPHRYQSPTAVVGSMKSNAV